MDDIIFKYDKLEGLKVGKSSEYIDVWVVSFDEIAWRDGLNDDGRYALFLHEIGHALLDRKHDNRTLKYEHCASLMRGEDYDCKSDIFSSNWQKYYLDELFDPSTPPPAWYTDLKELEIKTLIIDLQDTIIDFENSSYKGIWGIVEPFDVDETRDFVVRVEYDSIQFTDRLFYWKGFAISLEEIDSSLIISGFAPFNNKLVEHFYRTRVRLSSEKNTIQLTKKGDFLYIYFNDEMLHVMTYDPNDLFGPDNGYAIAYGSIFTMFSSKKMNVRLLAGYL
ncbi:MAG: hypothetical protein AAFN93_17160 [Bacteroidota bacterium]